MVVVVAEILMNNFFKKEKYPYSNDYDKILQGYVWVVAVTGMAVVVMALRAHVRQGVEEYISKKTA